MNLRTGALQNVSFTALSGEVIGVAGLQGCGLSNLLGVLFGVERTRGGANVYPDGKGQPRSTTDAARRGVCLVSADRRRNGLMLEKSIIFNMSQVAFGAQKGFFNR